MNNDHAPDKIRVVIVDDHSLVRQGVRAFLETQSDILVVGEADSGEAAIAVCQSQKPAVVLMDLVMPGMNGLEATTQIRKLHPQTQVIILTSFLDDAHIVPALRSGALSYLLKDAGAEELSHAIRKAARDEAVYHPQVANLMAQALRAENATRDAPLQLLSERETEVLRLIADGLSNAQIAAQLFISEKTVKSHVSNILAKLDLDDRTQAAVFAWRSGLMTGEN
jgi:NarL family two-component system response regulator LiaR